MSIIKVADARGHLGGVRGVVKRPVVDARAEARRIVAEAEERAAAIRRDAEAFAGDVRDMAYHEGYETALLKFSEYLLDARERRDTALARLEDDILRLSFKIAEKIIGHELDRDDRTLTGIVRTALARARQNETLLVRVNPADAPLVLQHREQLDAGGRAHLIEIIADPHVAHGGCVIESESGKLDAQLETQLRVLERALQETPGGVRPADAPRADDPETIL